MSQIVYTKLEGKPIQWPYGSITQIEPFTVIDNTMKTFSVSTATSSLINNTSTGTDNLLYGSTAVGQIFTVGSNAVNVSAVQLFGRKIGTPPFPIFVEIRRVKIGGPRFGSLQFFTSYTTTTISQQSVSIGVGQTISKTFSLGKSYLTNNYDAYPQIYHANSSGNNNEYWLSTWEGEITGHYTTGGVGWQPTVNWDTPTYVPPNDTITLNVKNVGTINSTFGDIRMRHCAETGALPIYGNLRAAVKTTMGNRVFSGALLPVYVFGTPDKPLKAELYVGSLDSTPVNSIEIQPTSNNFRTKTRVNMDLPDLLAEHYVTGSIDYYIVLSSSASDINNHYKLSSVGGGVIYQDDGTGWKLKNLSPPAMTTNSFNLTIYDKITRKNVSSSAVGTTNAWINFTLDAPVILKPNCSYAIVCYTFGGDANNCYAVQHSTVTSGGLKYNSTDGGQTWTNQSTANLSFQIMGFNMTPLYNGSYTIIAPNKRASTIVGLQAEAMASSGTIYLTMFDQTTAYRTTSSSTTSTQSLDLTPAPAEMLVKNLINNQNSWTIVAAGSGIVFSVSSAKKDFYNVPTITTRSFDVSELYLTKIVATSAGARVKINDLYEFNFTNSGDAFMVSEGEFLYPVRKISVEYGTATVYMIGVD